MKMGWRQPTFQLQGFYNKSKNNKWKHQNGLTPKCISPTKMSSNLIINKQKHQKKWYDHETQKKQIEATAGKAKDEVSIQHSIRCHRDIPLLHKHNRRQFQPVYTCKILQAKLFSSLTQVNNHFVSTTINPKLPKMMHVKASFH